MSRIASNITNWGLLQVGDELLKVGGRATLEMEHSILTGLIEKATNLELDVRRTYAIRHFVWCLYRLQLAVRLALAMPGCMSIPRIIAPSHRHYHGADHAQSSEA